MAASSASEVYILPTVQVGSDGEHALPAAFFAAVQVQFRTHMTDIEQRDAVRLSQRHQLRLVRQAVCTALATFMPALIAAVTLSSQCCGR